MSIGRKDHFAIVKIDYEKNFRYGLLSIWRDIAFDNGVFHQINHRSEVQYFFLVPAYGMSADEQEIVNILNRFAIGQRMLVGSTIPLDGAVE